MLRKLFKNLDKHEPHNFNEFFIFFCMILLLYQVSMNIYCTKFWTKIWITRWELKFFVSSRWEPKPHFIGACLVPPLPCSSNRLNGAGVFIIYSGQMHTVGYFPIDIFPGVSWKGGGGAESKHRSMMLHLSLPASRKQSLLSLTININVETILKDFPRLIIISHSFSYTPVILENKVVSTGNPLGSTVKLNACRLLSGTK